MRRFHFFDDDILIFSFLYMNKKKPLLHRSATRVGETRQSSTSLRCSGRDQTVKYKSEVQVTVCVVVNSVTNDATSSPL
ncbi:hypothetical protein J6590_001059 [Homalodisca vitripennis]|nr:hypothetical protein J6590_001059 [Homalodisca vitripennis]